MESEAVQTLHVRVCSELDYINESAEPIALNEEKALTVSPDLPWPYLLFTAPETANYTIFANGANAGVEHLFCKRQLFFLGNRGEPL